MKLNRQKAPHLEECQQQARLPLIIDLRVYTRFIFINP